MKKFITLSIICIFMLAYNAGKAQIFTSGFESWDSNTPTKPVGWFGVKTSLSADSGVTQYTTSVHGGTYACKLRNRTTSNKRLTTQGLSVTASSSYNFTFWIRGHGLLKCGYYKGAGSSGNQYVYTSTVFDTINTSSWIQKTFTITVDTTSAAAEFIILVKSTQADVDDIQVDDASITEGSLSSVSIHDIQYSATAPYASPYNGQPVVTGGIVTGKFNKGIFIQDASGPWNGLYVYDSAHVAAAGITVGDSITISGTVSEFYTFTELGNITNITKVSSGNTVHAAYSVTKANASTEELEGVLVSLTNMPCVEVTSASYGEFSLYNGDTTKVGGKLYKYTTALVGTNYDVTGIVYMDYNNIRVEPRDENDVTIHTGITENELNAVSIYPNPVKNNLFIENMNGIEKIRISNLLGETIESINITNNNINVNTENLSKGIYFITLFNNKGISETRKFSKE